MVKARTDRELSCAICALNVEDATFVRRRALPHGENVGVSQQDEAKKPPNSTVWLRPTFSVWGRRCPAPGSATHTKSVRFRWG